MRLISALFLVCVLLGSLNATLAKEPLLDYKGEHTNYGNHDRLKHHIDDHLKDIPHPKEMSMNDELYYLFSIHDVNRDGHLDGHELREAFSDWVEDRPTIELDEIIGMIDHVLSEDDTNNDGLISWEEYLLSQEYHVE